MINTDIEAYFNNLETGADTEREQGVNYRKEKIRLAGRILLAICSIAGWVAGMVVVSMICMGCGTRKTVIKTVDRVRSDSIVIRKTDTVIRERMVKTITEADSAWMKAWMECDSGGRVLMKYAEVLNGRKDRLEWQLDSLGRLEVKSTVGRDTVYVTVYDTTVVSSREKEVMQQQSHEKETVKTKNNTGGIILTMLWLAALLAAVITIRKIMKK